MRKAILFIFVLISSLTFANEEQDKITQDLLSLTRRPSVEKVFNAYQGNLPSLPSEPQRNKRGGLWMETIKQEMPRVIAELEYAYPGAIWAALGRDAVAIVDILEAFYLSVGQSGRVARIEASTATFRSSSDDFIKMLEQAGLPKDVKNVENMRPFIILDRTSYGAASQSTLLTKHIYDHYISKQVVNSSTSLFGKVAVVSSASGQDITRESVNRVVRGDIGHGLSHRIPVRILTSKGLGNFTDQGHQEWHQTFDQIVTDPDGHVGGLITGDSSPQHKQVAIWMMLEAYAVVRTPGFLEAVRQEAQNLGYNFDEHLKKYAEKYWQENQSNPSAVYTPPPPPEPTLEEVVSQRLKDIFKRAFPSLNNENNFAGLSWLYHKIEEKTFEEIANRSDQSQKIKSTDPIFDSIEQFIFYKNPEQVLEVNIRNPSSDYQKFLSAYLLVFPVHNPAYEGKSYLSDNGGTINDNFKGHLHSQLHIADLLERTFVYLKGITWAVENRIISMRDYRRLTLLAFGYFYNLWPKGYDYLAITAPLKTLMSEKPIFYQMLTERAEVFLTSKKNGGAAAEFYRELIKAEALPQVDECAFALKKEEGEGD